jgi:hypothetical protein
MTLEIPGDWEKTGQLAKDPTNTKLSSWMMGLFFLTRGRFQREVLSLDFRHVALQMDKHLPLLSSQRFLNLSLDAKGPLLAVLLERSSLQALILKEGEV